MIDSIQGLLSAAQQYAQLWRMLMPSVDTPEHSQFVTWAGIHREGVIARALSRTAAKTRRMRDAGTPMTAGDALRYSASVMRHETEGNRRITRNPSAASIAA